MTELLPRTQYAADFVFGVCTRCILMQSCPGPTLAPRDWNCALRSVVEPADAAQAAELARQLGETLTTCARLKRILSEIIKAWKLPDTGRLVRALTEAEEAMK